MNQSIVWLLNEKYGGQLTKKAAKDIARLRKGEPVDYVIGYKKFLGCKIDLRYRPLIPRDETEFWVGQAIKDLQRGPLCKSPERTPLGILDIFAGSGCCGIAVLKNVPNSCCDFADVDDSCLKQIRLNLKINKISKNRYRVIKSDIFEKLLTPSVDSVKVCPELAEGYDLILANPPYIGLAEKKKVQQSVLDFEPKKALFARDNGLYFIEKFLKQAKSYLKEEGVIYLEFGYNHKKNIEKLLQKFGYSNFKFRKDQFNKWRFVEIKN